MECPFTPSSTRTGSRSSSSCRGSPPTIECPGAAGSTPSSTRRTTSSIGRRPRPCSATAIASNRAPWWSCSRALLDHDRLFLAGGRQRHCRATARRRVFERMRGNMGADPIALVNALVEAGSIDTMYRDLYLGRAQTLLNPVMSLEDFHRLEQERALVAELPLAVARALEKGDWPEVKELSLRTEALKNTVGGKTAQLNTARTVYAVADVKLDPFCHSLQLFTRVSIRELPGVRNRVVEQLTTLEQSDLPWKDFYAARRTVFQTRAPIGSEPTPDGGATGTSAESVREAAAQALKAGDMKRLAQVADLGLTATSGDSKSGH